MNVEELTAALQDCNGNIIVVSGGREIKDVIYLPETSQEREVIELTLKPIKQKDK